MVPFFGNINYLSYLCIMLKECCQCNKYLPIENFDNDPEYPNELYFKCIICASEEEVIDQDKWNRRTYREQRSEYGIKKEGESSRKSWLKNKYNLSIEQYAEMVQKQNNLCAICGERETALQNGRTRCLSVDHHHGSGRVRGLLCSRCNTAIGSLKEDIQILESAIDYLKNN